MTTAAPDLKSCSCTLPTATAAGAAATGVLPRVVRLLLVAGAAGTLPGIVGHGESGYLYPDVQQQWVGDIVLVGVLVTAVTVVIGDLRRRHRG